MQLLDSKWPADIWARSHFWDQEIQALSPSKVFSIGIALGLLDMRLLYMLWPLWKIKPGLHTNMGT